MLAAASPYFAATLEPKFQKRKKGEFILKDADGDTVKAIVDYCYTGRIALTAENVGKFLAIASRIQLDLLEVKCARFFINELYATNCVDALMVGDKYNYVDIRQRAFALVCENFEELPTAEIQKLDHRLLLEILKRDQIQGTEDSVFRRLLEWFLYDESDRKQYMPTLLKTVLLEYVTLQVCLAEHFGIPFPNLPTILPFHSSSTTH